MKLLFYNIPAHGHVNVTLPVVSALVRRGVNVVYYCGTEFGARITATGAEFRAYEVPLYRGAGAPDPLEMAQRMIRTGAGLMPRLLREAERERASGIVFDCMTLWGRQLAESLRLPNVSTCPLYLIPPTPPPGPGAGERATPPRAARRRRPLSITLKLARYRAMAAYLRGRFGVRSPRMQDIFTIPGEITLVFSSREFQAGSERFGDAYRFVGASIDPSPARLDFAPADSRIIYVSLGTLVSDPALLRACAVGLADSANSVILSAGRAEAVQALGELPPNVIARPSVPQVEVLRRSVLFITHSGMNSTCEALWHGVPMICVPRTLETEHIARRVSELGAGILLSRAEVTPASLAAAARRVLADDAYRRESARLGQTLREAGGYARAADEIMRHFAPTASSSATRGDAAVPE